MLCTYLFIKKKPNFCLDSISLCSFRWPGTRYEDQAGLELTELLLASASWVLVLQVWATVSLHILSIFKILSIFNHPRNGMTDFYPHFTQEIERDCLVWSESLILASLSQRWLWRGWPHRLSSSGSHLSFLRLHSCGRHPSVLACTSLHQTFVPSTLSLDTPVPLFSVLAFPRASDPSQDGLPALLIQAGCLPAPSGARPLPRVSPPLVWPFTQCVLSCGSM